MSHTAQNPGARGHVERRGAGRLPAGPHRCIRRFLRFYPEGFADPHYVDLERGYKARAHLQWQDCLNEPVFRMFLADRDYREVATRAIRVESRTNLLFSFEKMALRDAVRSSAGARRFAEGLYDWLHGPDDEEERFGRWVDMLAGLPRRQTRVLTWPLATVFGFIARPDHHMYLKPTVTRRAAREYGYDFQYTSQPSWEGYHDLLTFANAVRRDLKPVPGLKARDLIDIQSFLWVQGSDEYR